ncbi:glycosyltransferase [Thorsellia anophelis]|uniref:Glycosyltransferase involved in cell wall bisynthesis n=1 Tax=Thorsellia anophelis DSM 18579 TaxID=1123402 RepID=A0A1I0FET0_9GAMM|nr:glycosyltransferase [Thorsellia anophelis]SET56776.1 Glycosyltransferase involved in cell wall bisynthesis [Thorsellia anophelis DSM 18579]
MSTYPIFLSVVFVVRNQSHLIKETLLLAKDTIASIVSDYEFIIVDNASNDNTLNLMQDLTSEAGMHNLQIYGLTKEVDSDTAAWAGLENALGDYVAVIDPLLDDISVIPRMIENALNGSDIVFAHNLTKPTQSLLYKFASTVFNRTYKLINGIHLAKEAPYFRLLNKSVINFILQHSQPSVIYRTLPAVSGFKLYHLDYNSPIRMTEKKKISESIDNGMRLLISNSRTPMRMVTVSLMFSAIANLIYSVYVVAVALFKSDVAPGWVSLSLQQSGMFFFLSLVLLVIGEYILNMVNIAGNAPLYHIGKEFTSAKMSRLEKLNIEIVDSSLTRQQQGNSESD